MPEYLRRDRPQIIAAARWRSQAYKTRHGIFRRTACKHGLQSMPACCKMPCVQDFSNGILRQGSKGSHAGTCRWQRWSPGLCGKRGNSATTSAATASLLVENVCWPAPRNRQPSARLTWGSDAQGQSGCHDFVEGPNTWTAPWSVLHASSAARPTNGQGTRCHTAVHNVPMVTSFLQCLTATWCPCSKPPADARSLTAKPVCFVGCSRRRSAAQQQRAHASAADHALRIQPQQ